MAPAVADPPKLLSAEEYLALPDDGRFTELVKGEVIDVPRPNFRHGVVCNKIGRLLGEYVAARGLGWVLNNDSGILTERDPDTLRGADVAFFSYQRVPKDDPPTGYPEVAPELVFEVLSPSDRWSDLSPKIDEYLRAGVVVVVVAEPDQRHVMTLEQDKSPRFYGPDDELALPQVFPDFRVTVRSLFD